MNKNHRRNVLRFTARARPTVASAACDDSDSSPAPVSTAVANRHSTPDAQTSRTRVPTKLTNAPGASGDGDDILLSVSAGDDVPLLTGTSRPFVPDAELTDGLAGDFDGTRLPGVDDGHFPYGACPRGEPSSSVSSQDVDKKVQ